MICPVASYDWHVFARVLHPQSVLQVFAPVYTVPQSRAHSFAPHGSGTGVLVVVRDSVVVVWEVNVCVVEVFVPVLLVAVPVMLVVVNELVVVE